MLAARIAGLGDFFDDYGSMIISLSALLFTIGTFWWNNWRRGRLVLSIPPTFALTETGTSQSMSLPVVIQNTGPRDLAVIALRLTSPNGEYFEHHFVRSSMNLDNTSKEPTAAFIVPGRSVNSAVREFSSHGESWAIVPGIHHFQLLALQAGREDWSVIGSFPLAIEADFLPKIRGSYISYRNGAAFGSPGTIMP